MTPPSARVTLKEVASRAGVSVSTASKALNDRGDVAAATRDQVLRAAHELSFAPNSLAQGLLTGRSRAIGLLTDEMAGRFSFPVLLGIESKLGSEDMSVLLCDARGDAIREKHYVRALLARQVDGLIVAGENTNPRPPIAGRLPVPVVYAYAPSEDPDDISLTPDDHGGAVLATRHLLTLGRTRIAHVTGATEWRASRERAAGFLETLAAAGLEPAHEVLHGEWTQRWGRRAADILLTDGRPFDAVVCGSDQIATGVMDALRDRGLSVPSDVSIVGYDNWKVFAEETRPPLTTVDMNLERLGVAAVKALFDAIEGRRDPGVHRQACRLIVRDSTSAA